MTNSPASLPESRDDQSISDSNSNSEYSDSYSMESPVPYIPHRVISLVPSVTESLFDLDLGDRLIGVTDYCIRPAEKVARLRKIGGTKNPDIETIKALRPDLVILNREENRKEDADALQAAGVPIWVTEPRTVKEAIDLLWAIMNIFEQASMTERVRLIEITYEMTLKYMTAETPVKVFAPIWRDPYMTFNRETYIHDLLATCGASNVFADRDRRFPLAADLGEGQPLPPDDPPDPRHARRDTRYPRVTLEEVESLQPALILLPDEPYQFAEADKLDFLRLNIPAVKNDQIKLVDGSLLTWHGTRLAYALRDLPPIIAAARGE